ncbi:FHA domain-containing protein [Frigoribacterium sp. ACAM 257]|uniref:FHA domain-containing protein n=1 Tax=Frigoribacterium sp. ACAM 257 TaxID=2508998 RepID=UPI0011BA21F3|nr:FHA domain-containing protein [Frigoribacterium sp. ACAM 257]TWX38505.1 FHA domain-containing protein [Frigoribacterium sp. ACAM 257]
MASRCEYCGAELRPNSMFCLSCGQLVTSGRAPVAAPLPAPVASTRPPLERTAPPVARPAAAPAAAPAPPSPVVANATFVVTFSTGQRLVVDGPVVVGRRPEQAAAEVGSAAFAVTDPERSTSRAHAVFDVVDGQLVVTDRGSGNGTVAHRAGVEIACVEGQPVALRPGDELELGSVAATVAAG